jgi:O-antigen/teichoic acid export membrane protein
MAFKLPSLLKHGLLYGASIALMKGISLLMLPFIAHRLTEAEFGQLEVVSSIAMIGSVLVGMGLEDALYRFAGAEKESKSRHRLAGNIYTLTLLIGIAMIPAAWYGAATVANWVPGDIETEAVQLILLMLALEGGIAVPLGWLRMRDMAGTFFLVTTGRAVLQAILTVVFLNMDRGVIGVLEAGVYTALLQALILGYLQIRDTGLGLSPHIAKRAMTYSFPIVLSGILAFTLNGLDRWILAQHASLEQVAHFGVAAKFAIAVVLLLQPYGMWWMPKRFEILFGDDGRQRVVLYTSTGVALTLIITVAVSLGTPVLIEWLMPAGYAIAGQYAALLILAAACKELSEFLNLGCFAGNTTRAQVVINAISGAAGLGFMLWLTPLYAVWGVTVALLAAQLLRLILFYIIGQRLFHIPYPLASGLLLTVAAVAWIAVGMMLELSVWARCGMALLATFSMLLLAIRLEMIKVPISFIERWMPGKCP